MNTESLQSLKAQLERELRDAERGLAARTLAAQSRYANALYELDRVEHLIRRYEDRHHSFDAHAHV
ncbi:MAG: hypothetical protein ACJ790_14530 [Myxococcaceae bacterium]